MQELQGVFFVSRAIFCARVWMGHCWRPFWQFAVGLSGLRAASSVLQCHHAAAHVTRMDGVGCAWIAMVGWWCCACGEKVRCRTGDVWRHCCCLQLRSRGCQHDRWRRRCCSSTRVPCGVRQSVWVWLHHGGALLVNSSMVCVCTDEYSRSNSNNNMAAWQEYYVVLS